MAEHDPEPSLRDRASRLIEEFAEGPQSGGATGTFRIPLLLRESMLDGLHALERMLVEAREVEASDLHVVVGSPVMVKIHGRFTELEGGPLTAPQAWALIEPLLGGRERKVLLAEQACDFCHVIEGVGRHRANVYVESKGPAAAFRLIPSRIPSLSDVGLPGHLADIVNYNQGLVVIAGPSGSGKSTTLAALVNLFNETKRRHILLLEDPIEFVHPPKACLINQREVGKHAKSFAAALRGALRQDPDVIVVGEMRDPETVRLAIEASETGHLVIGTMHTTSAPKTVDRLVESFPVAEQDQIRMMLSETLKMVVCQTLLPRADGEGRVACFEVMIADLGISSMIRDGKTFQILGQMQIGEMQGQQTWDTALERLVEARQITPELAYARARRASRFRHLVEPAGGEAADDA
jgi:twitching motility protein PilT